MSNVTYVRWRLGESRRGRVFPSLAPNHPAYAVTCLLCDQTLGNGTPVQLLVVEAATALDAHRWHTAEAVIAHESCIATLGDSAIDALLDELVPTSTE